MEIIGYILALYVGIGLGFVLSSAAKGSIFNALFCIVFWPIIVFSALFDKKSAKP